METSVHDMAARIMLVAFETGGRPRFARKNRKESKALAAAHNVESDKVSTAVTQCNHPTLSAIDELQRKAHIWHKDHTLPTITSGMRQLKADGQMEYMRGMAGFQTRNQALLDAFFVDYPQLKDDAPRVNNGLYDPAPWKPLEELRKKHVWQLQVLPCPSDGEWGAGWKPRLLSRRWTSPRSWRTPFSASRNGARPTDPCTKVSSQIWLTCSPWCRT